MAIKTPEFLCGNPEALNSASGLSGNDPCRTHLFGYDCDKDDVLDWLAGWHNVLNHSKNAVNKVILLRDDNVKHPEDPSNQEAQFAIQEYETLLSNYNSIKTSIENTENKEFKNEVNEIKNKYKESLCNLQKLQELIIGYNGSFIPTNISGQAEELTQASKSSDTSLLTFLYWGVPIFAAIWLTSYAVRTERRGFYRSTRGVY